MEGRRVRRRVGRTERGRHRAPRVGRFRPRKGHPLGPRQRVQQGGSRLSSPQAEPFDAVVVGFAHGCRSPAQSTLGVDCRRGVHIAAPQRRGRPPPNATGGRVPRHQWQRLDRGDECSQAREGDYRRRAGGARRSRFPPRRRRRRQQRHHLGHAPAPARAGAPGATPARGDGRQHGRGLKAALRFDHERVFACVGDDRRPQRQRQRGKPPGVRTPAIERELAAANRRRHGIIARDHAQAGVGGASEERRSLCILPEDQAAERGHDRCCRRRPLRVALSAGVHADSCAGGCRRALCFQHHVVQASREDFAGDQKGAADERRAFRGRRARLCAVRAG
eukprot:Opistho-1_new@97245